MSTVTQSAGEAEHVLAGTLSTGQGAVAPLAARDGGISIRDLIDAYMALYAGRDPTRPQRLRWWIAKVGNVRLRDLTDDDIYHALEDLAAQRGRYYAGEDADGKPIYKAKGKSVAPATLNRYGAALGAVLSWSIKKRIAPRGWSNPAKCIERRDENNEIVRFLSQRERDALLAECKRSTWKMLYAFVLLALTTGARRGELERLRWGDIDFASGLAAVHHTKNGDRRTLPLLPAVIEELRRFEGEPTALVFASQRRPDVPYNHVSTWHDALRKAGVKTFRFHDLRHSCASYLAQKGATLLEIADVLGHKQLSVTKRYSHLTTTHKAALVNRVLGEIK